MHRVMSGPVGVPCDVSKDLTFFTQNCIKSNLMQLWFKIEGAFIIESHCGDIISVSSTCWNHYTIPT